MRRTSQHAKRFRYQRIDSKHDYCGRVIVELGDDPLDERSMELFDQQYGEVRWYRFEPEDVERDEIKRLVAQQRGRPADGQMLIDIEKLRRKQSRTAAVTVDAAVVVPGSTLSCVAT